MIPTRASAPAAPAPALTVAEVALATGTTPHTLRYYERIGLIQPVPRADSGHRRYGPDEVRWIGFLRKLHATGMPIRRMLAYAELARRGAHTAAARRALLEEHRDEVLAKLHDLQSNLQVIEQKITMYCSLEFDG